jgi:hypothetical protein
VTDVRDRKGSHPNGSHPKGSHPTGSAGRVGADARDGAIIFRDLIGKLDVLNVECGRCSRAGRYHLHQLIERHGIDAKLFERSDEDHGRLPAEASAKLE